MRYLLLSLLFQSFLLSAQVIKVSLPRQEYLLPVTQLPVLVDSTGGLSFVEVLEKTNEFKIDSTFTPREYCLSCAYWVKVSVNLPENGDKTWMIEFYDQTIDSLMAFIPNLEGSYKRHETGDYFPFAHKEFYHKNFEWILPNSTDTMDVYFRVKSHSYADIRLVVRTVNRFIFYSLNEYFLYGLFYGMIFIISLYNTLMFFAIKEKRYLYYTFYILSVGIYAMCIDGIAYQYLWPNWPQWNQIAYAMALYSLIMWCMVFSMFFLNTKYKAPNLHKALKLLIILRSLLFIYGLLIDHRVFEWRNLEIISLTLIFYASVRIWTKGYKPARFFVVAYGFLFLGFLIKALLYLSIIPFTILSYYSLHVCFLLEMLFLSFALGDRVRILKANRDRALQRIILQHQENVELKDRVNRELEVKIKERTQELEHKNVELAEANTKLHRQTEEIGKINSKLDLDNWKLKNNMKEVLQDRLLNKGLSYEQFKSLFPTELVCYKFLEKLKWGGGFKCVKCHHDKYSEGKSRFSRRCTRCGYDESITSNTVFHKIKFPIEKAFFIVYIVTNDQEHLTLDQLAELLDMRRNTIWSFKKKIVNMMSKMNESGVRLMRDMFIGHLHH